MVFGDAEMSDFPRSLREFESCFPDYRACARWLAKTRWPDGSVCPACGHVKGGELARGLLTYQCAGCRKQTSVTAGTVLHRSHLPLEIWFLAAWLVATHKNGISAWQLWLQLGLGSYKTAWLLLQKLRHTMVNPDQSPLSGLVQVDETSMPFRTKETPINANPGHAHDGKMMIAGAVEIHDRAPGRLRLRVIDDYSAKTLGGFVSANLNPGSTAVSDGWSGYTRLKDVKHQPKIVGPMAAHVLLPWIHRVFGKAKRWAMGIYHGFRRPHLQRNLDEFVFHFNRRKTPEAAFASLFGIAMKLDHASYHMLIQRS
jgi:hypothetical protein